MDVIGVPVVRLTVLTLGCLTLVAPSVIAQDSPETPGISRGSPDTIRVGHPALAGAAPVPGTFTIENHRRADGEDRLVSTTRQTIRRERVGGTDAWVIETLHASGDTTRSAITVRAEDLSLIHHRVTGALDSTAVAVGDLHLTGWVVLPDTPIRLLDRRLEAPVFPVEGQVPWLFPLLPMDLGYEATIPHFNQWQDGLAWKTIRVTGSERLTIDGNGVDCWVVDGGELFRGYDVTYWVDRVTRRIVRGIARGSADGPEFWSEVVPASVSDAPGPGG